jgi:CRP-like cAMP-binding protein
MSETLHEIWLPALQGALALAAMLSAIAFRRRTRMFTPAGFIMVALGLMLELMTPRGAYTAAVPQWAPYLRAGAIALFGCGIVRLGVEAVGVWSRRQRVQVSTFANEVSLTLLYAVTLIVTARYILNFDIRRLVALPALFALASAWFQHRDLFSGLLIHTQRPFRTGDWVRVGTQVGQVQETSLQTTRILTSTHESVTIPNVLLAKELCTNYSTSPAVADELFFRLGYSESPGAVETVVRNLLADLPEVLQDPPPEVGPAEFGNYSIRYRIKYWLADYGRQEAVRARTMRSLWYALRRHSISIPGLPSYVRPSSIASGNGLDADAHILAELRAVDLLKDLSDADLLILIPSVTAREYGRGEVLIHQNETGDCFFILRRGKVEVIDEGANGRAPRVVGHIEHSSEKNFFGEIAFLKGEPRLTTIRATTDVEVLEIDRSGLSHLFRARPEIALGVAKIAAAREEDTMAQASAVLNSSAINGDRQNRTFQTMRRIFDF